MFDYLENLNDVQREAVIRTEGPALVVAGAGSGKTRVLTYRIAHLLKQGVKPSTILALTFTNKAAGEMKERIASVVGQSMARYLWMGTFHSVFARILRMEHEAVGYPADYTIYDAADARNLIKTIIKDFGLDDKTYRPGVVANRISMSKNNLVTPGAYDQNREIREYDRSILMPKISEIYREYAKRCRISHAMDFDDLLLITNILFRDHPEILEKYQKHFDYVLVDEYQDTNYAQYLIVQKLAAIHQNICVVGDDAQSIYSFRGARIENILNFQRDYPSHKVFKLEQNYRSTQTIVNAANSIIAHNERQIRKKIYSEKEEGSLIRVIQALTDNEEGFRVATLIAETQLRDHFRYEDYAILYRTNAQSRIFEESLRRVSIPYKIFGGLSFYQRKEIKDLLAYFRVIINRNDNEAVKRIINYPARGIGQTTLTKLEAESSAGEKSIMQVIDSLQEKNFIGFNSGTLDKIGKFRDLMARFRDLADNENAFNLARTVASETGLLKELYNDRTPEGLSRFENMQELLNAIQEFSVSALEEGRSGGIGDYLQQVALLTDQDNEKEEDKNKVALMTVHSAKGLEFKNVFVVGLEKNLFPTAQPGERLTRDEYEEERRLFYVAVTRAEKNLFLTYATQRYKWGKLEFCDASPFISEIDPAFVENTETSGGSLFRPGRQTWNSPRPQSPSAPPTPQATPSLRSSFTRKITNLREENGTPASSENFDDANDVVPGIMVEHQRFGVGKVLQVEGVAPDLKATVFFHNAGQKQLLLRFARLRIIR